MELREAMAYIVYIDNELIRGVTVSMAQDTPYHDAIKAVLISYNFQVENYTSARISKSFKDVREEVCLTANDIIHGDRNASYGDPLQDFKRTANLINACFGTEFTSTDVARLMILLKISRSMASPKLDNWIDIAGYAACGAHCDQG